MNKYGIKKSKQEMLRLLNSSREFTKNHELSNNIKDWIAYFSIQTIDYFIELVESLEQ